MVECTSTLVRKRDVGTHGQRGGRLVRWLKNAGLREVLRYVYCCKGEQVCNCIALDVAQVASILDARCSLHTYRRTMVCTSNVNVTMLRRRGDRTEAFRLLVLDEAQGDCKLVLVVQCNRDGAGR